MAKTTADRTVSRFWRRLLLAALLRSLAEPISLLLLALCYSVIPEWLGNGIFGSAVRSFFEAIQPFVGFLVFPVAVLSYALRRAAQREALSTTGLPPEDTCEKHGPIPSKYARSVFVSMANAGWLGALGLLCVLATGQYVFGVIAICLGFALKLAMLPRRRELAVLRSGCGGPPVLDHRVSEGSDAGRE
jgi:hypothetical protein